MADRTVDASSVGIRAAIEAVAETPPATGWTLALQPNSGGVQGFVRKNDTVERAPLSVWAANEKGDIVGHSAQPKITCDYTFDVALYMASSMFRSNPNVPGGTGTAFFRPSAAVDGGVGVDSFTVAAGGAFAAGTLIRTQGFKNATNNALFVTQAGSVAGSVKVLTGLLVAEVPAATDNQILMAVGVEAGAGDVKIDAGNNLTSTTLDFTTLGWVVGMPIIIGDEAAGTRFASLPTEKCVAIIAAVPTAHAVQLKEHSWPVAGADVGAAKTIRIFHGLHYSNRARNDAAFYAKPTHNLEKEDLNSATGNTVSSYTNANGSSLAKWKLNGPLKGKLTIELEFCGLSIANPVLAAGRAAGPANAFQPLCTAIFDTSNDLEHNKVIDGANDLIAEVDNWTLDVNMNVKPKEVQGKNGAIGHKHGIFEPEVALGAYFNDMGQIVAANDNRNLVWRTLVANQQGGFMLRMPYTAFRAPEQPYQANDAVMLNGNVPAFKDPDTNVVMSLTLFGYVPFGGS